MTNKSVPNVPLLPLLRGNFAGILVGHGSPYDLACHDPALVTDGHDKRLLAVCVGLETLHKPCSAPYIILILFTRSSHCLAKPTCPSETFLSCTVIDSSKQAPLESKTERYRFAALLRPWPSQRHVAFLSVVLDKLGTIQSTNAAPRTTLSTGCGRVLRAAPEAARVLKGVEPSLDPAR